MARTSEATKTYRRVPGDIDEVRYISELISADAKARLAALVAEEKYDEMHTLLEYRDKWKGMLADLIEEAEDDIAEPTRSLDSGGRIQTPGPMATTEKSTAKPPRNATAGGAPKAPADETK